MDEPDDGGQIPLRQGGGYIFGVPEALGDGVAAVGVSGTGRAPAPGVGTTQGGCAVQAEALRFLASDTIAGRRCHPLDWPLLYLHRLSIPHWQRLAYPLAYRSSFCARRERVGSSLPNANAVSRHRNKHQGSSLVGKPRLLPACLFRCPGPPVGREVEDSARPGR